MDTTTAPTIPEPCRDFDHGETLRQIGRGNLMAISGFQYQSLAPGLLALPAGNGYSVEITLDFMDTYTVARIFTRSGVKHLHGVRTDVYCDELSEVAYYASCHVSYDAETWPTKA